MWRAQPEGWNSVPASPALGGQCLGCGAHPSPRPTCPAMLGFAGAKVFGKEQHIAAGVSGCRELAGWGHDPGFELCVCQPLSCLPWFLQAVLEGQS